MTTMQRLPGELVKGDVITVHPWTGAHGEWIVDSPAVVSAGDAEIAVSTPEGLTGQIVVADTAELTVRVCGRPAHIAALRRLAQFLEDNPGVPEGSVTVRYFPRGDDQFEEVDRIAALMGVRPVDGPHYVAVLSFGAEVEYAAVVCAPRPVPAEEEVSG